MGKPALLQQSPSEERLGRISAGAWSPAEFRSAAAELARVARFEVALCIDMQHPIPLPADSWFKYSDDSIDPPEPAPGAETLVATVTVSGRIIGYGIAVRGTRRRSEITIIDVDQSSRRSAGVAQTILIEGEPFGVGVGHVIADFLAANIPGAIDVDATTDESRYIFLSLGFVRTEGADNPCLLERAQ